MNYHNDSGNCSRVSSINGDNSSDDDKRSGNGGSIAGDSDIVPPPQITLSPPSPVDDSSSIILSPTSTKQSQQQQHRTTTTIISKQRGNTIISNSRCTGGGSLYRGRANFCSPSPSSRPSLYVQHPGPKFVSLLSAIQSMKDGSSSSTTTSTRNIYTKRSDSNASADGNGGGDYNEMEPLVMRGSGNSSNNGNTATAAAPGTGTDLLLPKSNSSVDDIISEIDDQTKLVIFKMINDNKMRDLGKFLRRREKLNTCNIFLIYIFFIFQSAGIFLTAASSRYNNSTLNCKNSSSNVNHNAVLLWCGVACTFFASIINTFEHVNNSISEKTLADIIDIKEGNYVDERVVVQENLV